MNAAVCTTRAGARGVRSLGRSASATLLARRGFTLTELMIAVAVLIGVLLASSKIFSTSSRVATMGKASEDILQEAAAIERQIRADLAALFPEGIFAIRCVAVPNDVNDPINRSVLLNPNLPSNASIRADQLLFFANGLESSRVFYQGREGDARQALGNVRGQGTISRVYYGHAFQLGDVGEPVIPGQGRLTSMDPLGPVYPWTMGSIETVKTQVERLGDLDRTDVFRRSSESEVDIALVDARRWLLARQSVILVDDDNRASDTNYKTVYLDEVLTGRSIFLNDRDIGFTPQIMQGRVDAAATLMNEVRDQILHRDNANRRLRCWTDLASNCLPDTQYAVIADELLYYPRAERVAPGRHRADQALTNHVISTACSSVRIEWTYADGVGEATDDAGRRSLGIRLDELTAGSGRFQQPWFGLPDEERGVGPYGDDDYRDFAQYAWAETILPVGDLPNNIERISRRFQRAQVYEAIFGFNQTVAIDEATRQPEIELGYTPWPTAIRVTLTLHDPATTLESGREVQFVIDLPKRTQVARR